VDYDNAAFQTSQDIAPFGKEGFMHKQPQAWLALETIPIWLAISSSDSLELVHNQFQN
jgi:hypothetical protein